ncbi:MAG: DUF3054 domain-containing protein [Corynebacterium sp.]|nr:DUF3054 domain-containing protein [Corynebacterium sp.]
MPLHRSFIFDLGALFVFAIAARAAHPPFTLAGLIDAWWPWTLGLLIGWTIIATTKLKAASIFAQGLTAWVAAIALGMTAWTLVNGQVPHYSFLIVAATMSALLMFGWRFTTTLIHKKRDRT